MEEKMYHTVKSSGIMSLVAAPLATAVGISALISGIRLWLARTKILF